VTAPKLQIALLTIAALVVIPYAIAQLCAALRREE
jgi:hypothetical protein